MGERFLGLLIVSWFVTLIAVLAFGYGLTMIVPNQQSSVPELFSNLEATARTTIGVSLMVYGIFGILTSGAVCVLISIHQHVQRIAASIEEKGKVDDGNPELALTSM